MFHKPKGTIDYYPDDFDVLSQMTEAWRRVAGRYGFREVESPAFEELSLLSEKEGEEIKEQIFVLEQRSGESFGLRFDLTVPLARMFINVQKEIQKPVKWSYATRMWRYERPQKGRLREFTQFGVEVYGSSLPDADAEVINLAVDCLKELGLTDQQVFVNINNRNLIQGILEDLVPRENLSEALSIIDKREKIPEDEFFKLLKAVRVKDPSKLIEILDLTDLDSILKLKLNKTGLEGYKELAAVMKLLDPAWCRVSLSTVRGLAYYTGTVFEIFDTKGAYRSICGGGRYDRLISLFGGEATPAVGFSFGCETLKLVLQDLGKLPAPREATHTFVAVVDETVRDLARSIAASLRATRSTQLDLSGRSLSKQLAYASSIGAKQAVIVGPTDAAKGEVTTRDLATGTEQKVSISALTVERHSTPRPRHPPRAKG